MISWSVVLPKSQLRAFLQSGLPAIGIVLAQLLACLFFVADALSDQSTGQDTAPGSILEIGVAMALMAGVVLGAVYLFHLLREIRIRAAVVAVARGTMSRLISERFVEWKLSAAEADVALFALKGCSIAEIAQLRSSALGTVRAQLSQVYGKAEVSGQSMLMAVFLEELMSEIELPAAVRLPK